MPSLLELDSPPQIPAAWGSLYVALAQEEPVKPRHVMAAKKPAYGYGGGRNKKNLETCTEALGCETGAVDAAPCNGTDLEVEAAAERAAERKRRAREEEEEEEEKARRPLPPPLTTRGGVRIVHERRDGRLAMYAVRAPGMEAERGGGRLRMRMRMRLVSSLPSACRGQEQEEAVEEGECCVAKYVCVETEGAAAGEARQAVGGVGAGAGCHVLGRHLLNTTTGLVAPAAY